MKNLLIYLLFNQFMLVPVLAQELINPKQDIKNTKGFASINYDRQDSENTGEQKIINEKSAFNINVIIVKKGALFCKDKPDIDVK